MSGLVDHILKQRNSLLSKHYNNAYPSSASSIDILNKWIGEHNIATDYITRRHRDYDYLARWNTVMDSATPIEEELPTAPQNALPLLETLDALKRNGIVCSSIRNNLDYCIWFIGSPTSWYKKDGNDRCVIDEGSVCISVPVSALPGHMHLDEYVSPHEILPTAISINATKFAPKFRESDRRMMVYFPSEQVDGIIFHAEDWYVTDLHFTFCTNDSLESYIGYLTKLIRKSEELPSPESISVFMPMTQASSSYQPNIAYDIKYNNPVTLVPVPTVRTTEDKSGLSPTMPTLDQLDDLVKQYVKGYCDLDNCLRSMIDDPMAAQMRTDYQRLQDLVALDTQNKESMQSRIMDAVLNLGFQSEISNSGAELRALAEQGFKKR